MLGAHDGVTQDGVVETESAFQFINGLLSRFNVHQNVVSFVQLVDWVSQLTAAPVFQASHFTAAIFDDTGVALDHARNLFALIRVDHDHDFVMTHDCSLRVSSLTARPVAIR